MVFVGLRNFERQGGASERQKTYCWSRLKDFVAVERDRDRFLFYCDLRHLLLSLALVVVDTLTLLISRILPRILSLLLARILSVTLTCILPLTHILFLARIFALARVLSLSFVIPAGLTLTVLFVRSRMVTAGR